MSLFGAAPSPASAAGVVPPSTSPERPFFLIFLASVDEKTGQSWCPDCTRVESTIEELVPADRSALIHVGSRDEWRKPDNAFKQAFKLTNLPTIVRIESGNQDSAQDQIASAPRLIEGELLQTDAFKKFLKL